MVRDFYDTLLATMKDGPTLGFAGRVDRLAPVITKSFDLPLMTRIAAGAQWASIASDDQHHLVDAFSRFSIASYAANFDSYDNERFEILGELPIQNGTGTIVETRLIPSKGDPVQMNYLLRPSPSGLKIIDVFINGTISEMAGRRSEFSSTLARGGAPALLEALEARTRTLASKK